MNKRLLIISKISLTAIMTALIFVVTLFIQIPYPGNGYFNFSDALILFTTIFIGPLEGFISGVISCCLVDFKSGYAMFVPFTFFAKGLESIVCFIIYFILRKTRFVKYISFYVGGIVMFITYFIAYIILNDLNTALSLLPFDIVQGLVGASVGLILYLSLIKTNLKLNNLI